MEFCRNASVSSALLPEPSPENVIAPASSDLGSTVNELFPHLRTEEEVSLEWLSVFVEDCLSSTGNCLPTAQHHQNFTAITKPFKSMHKSHQYPFFDTKFAIPVKPRSKRRRPTSPKTHKKPSISWVKSKLLNPMKNSTPQFTSSDPPPLLQQSQWLADSELIMLPRIEGSCCINDEEEESRKGAEEEENKRKKMDVGKESSGGGGVQGGQARRCSHCQAQKTPQWRAGPLGPKTLCNACGVRFKSGRLFPEYRPAKSPTFVSCMHSNSHKKVLEMRMALLASSS